MPNVDFERKRATRWPWFLGLALLAIALWGVTTLLGQDDAEAPLVTVPTVEDTHPPAAIPAPPVQGGGATSGPRGIDELAPLGEEDVGQTVRVEGPVVATGNDAFWLLAGTDVVQIESSRRVRRGDTLAVEGTLRRADPDKTQRISDVLARHPGSEAWSVVDVVKLVEDAPPEPDASATGRRDA